MKIAFYFDNRHLGRWNWDSFVAGELPASGTDGQFLGLYHRMSLRGGVEAMGLFGGGLPDKVPGDAVAVDGLAEAAGRARAGGAALILFNHRDREETERGLKRCEELGVPAVLWDQNGPFPEARDALAAAGALRRLVVVSHSHADTLRGHALSGKTCVIYNSLLFDSGGEVARAARAERVCFLGATISQKGFHHLVKAWPAVRRARPTAELIVIGSSRLYGVDRPLGPLGLSDPEFESEHVVPHWGPSMTDLERLGVRLKGLMAPVALRRVLRDCAVAVVNPCVRNGSYETFCVSAIEAQAAGCAVVGGRRLGLRETVRHGQTGVLIKRESDLAPAIIGLLNDPGRARAMGAAGSRWVREAFAAERADALWLELFQEVMGGKPNRPPRIKWRLMTPGVALRMLRGAIQGAR
ncbi:MAG: glycosyltransferase family 4 protein [Verrucomicrobiae bacterium]|nr:glycosyltransferase family 4 protein [Verrucomicrobiae bacterium]